MGDDAPAPRECIGERGRRAPRETSDNLNIYKCPGTRSAAAACRQRAAFHSGLSRGHSSGVARQYRRERGVWAGSANFACRKRHGRKQAASHLVQRVCDKACSESLVRTCQLRRHAPFHPQGRRVGTIISNFWTCEKCRRGVGRFCAPHIAPHAPQSKSLFL